MDSTRCELKSFFLKFGHIIIFLIFHISLIGQVSAKSVCGEKSCYACCSNNCRNIVLKLQDRNRLSIKEAVKACDSGCQTIVWTGSSLSGRLLERAEENLNKRCTEKKGRYSEYCMRALGLWGQSCSTPKKDSFKTTKSRSSGIDGRWSDLETSVKKVIFLKLLRSVFPSLSNSKFGTLSNSKLIQGINFRLISTPARLVQSFQNARNRVSQIYGILPLKKLNTIEEILSSFQSEITNYVPLKVTRPKNTDSRLGKYAGMSEEAIFLELNNDMQEIMGLLSKPNMNNNDLKTAISKLLRIYEQLERETNDSDIKQMIQQLKTTFNQLLSTL